jgi:hypothetical protein
MRMRALSILLIGAALAGCKDSSGAGGSHPAAITATTSGDLSAAVGNPLPLSVKVTGASGEAVPGVTVLWTVSSGGGSVSPASSVTDASGVATTTWTMGPSSGSQTAMARFDASHFVTFTATATPGPALAVHVTPDSTTLASFGDTTRLTATATDANHNPVPATWQSLDPSIATVNSASGVVTAVSNGRARIVGSASGLSDTSIVRVQQVPASLTATPSPLTAEVGVNTPLTVTAKDARGNLIALPTLSFASTNTAVATVSAAGVVTSQATGSASIVITGGTAADTVPVTVTATGRYTSVSALNNATCGTTAGGTLRCWGNLYSGLNSATPVTVSAPVPLHGVATGEGYGCALGPDNTAYCWGIGGYIGDGGLDPSASAVPVRGSIVYGKLSAGSRHTCGVDTAGSAWCWGLNQNGLLGVVKVSCGSEICPVPREVLNHTFTDLEAGGSATCAIGTDAQVYCWGNQWGLTPTLVSTAGGTYTDAAEAVGTVCALQGGTPYCWSQGTFGAGTPVAGSPSFTHIDGGFGFFCGVTAAGAAYCWGANDAGQLGTGSTSATPAATPQLVAGGHTFSSVSAGYRHACGVASDGVYCWGQNDYGDVGTGSAATAVVATPVKVVGQP